MKVIDNNCKYSIPEPVVKINRIIDTDNVIVSKRKSEDCYYLEQDGSNTYTFSEGRYKYRFWNPTIDVDKIWDVPTEPILEKPIHRQEAPTMEELQYFIVPDDWKPTIGLPYFIWAQPNKKSNNIPLIKNNSQNTTINAQRVELTDNLIKIDRVNETDKIIVNKLNQKYYVLNEDNVTYTEGSNMSWYYTWGPKIKENVTICDVPAEPIIPIDMNRYAQLSPEMDKVTYDYVPEHWKPTIDELVFIGIPNDEYTGEVSYQLTGNNVNINIVIPSVDVGGGGFSGDDDDDNE